MKYSRLPFLRAIGAHVPPTLVTTREVYVRNRLRGLCHGGRWQIRIDCGDGKTFDFVRCGAADTQDFAADPFVVVRGGVPYLFFETTRRNGKGVIACTHLVGGRWIDDGIVLEQPTHLSYPQVFERDGAWFMIPESGASDETGLYRAADFPRKWEKVAAFFPGNHADSTLWIQDDGCYLFSLNHRPTGDVLELWCADRVEGPWTPHPKFVINASRRLSRPAGRCFAADGRLYRLAQDCNGGYGKRVFRVPVLALSRTDYREGAAELVLAPPRGFVGAHTYGEVDVNGARWRVFDLNFVYRLPLGQIVRNFWNFVFGRFFAS